MPGIDGHVSVQPGKREPEDTRGAAYGRILFVIYLVLYSGFVLTTAFAPQLMERVPFGGINLSVLYGLGLIATAIFMAILYDWLCRPVQVAKSERGERP